MGIGGTRFRETQKLDSEPKNELNPRVTGIINEVFLIRRRSWSQICQIIGESRAKQLKILPEPELF